MRLLEELPGLNCEVEHALERGELAVDLTVRDAQHRPALFWHMARRAVPRREGEGLSRDRCFLLPRVDVLADVCRRDRRHLPIAEERRQVLLDSPLDIVERTLSVGTVVVDHVLDGFVEADTADFRCDGDSTLDVPSRRRNRLFASPSLVLPSSLLSFFRSCISQSTSATPLLEFSQLEPLL